jgi:hypothetical protein
MPDAAALERDEKQPVAIKPRWRVGTQVPINVYEGDRPVCQCQTALDARRIVEAMNRLLPEAPDTPETVAEKAKAARRMVDRFRGVERKYGKP